MILCIHGHAIRIALARAKARELALAHRLTARV
jgi:hypothetical protein